MKDYINLITVSLLIYFLYTFCQKEGYINKPLKDEPDDLQFYACHDSGTIDFKGLPLSMRGNNNYKLKRHGVGEPLQGAYSYFLDTYKLRNYDEIFHAPVCEGKYNFKDVTNLNMPEILDHDDVVKEEKMLLAEEDYEKNSIKDPYYSYVSPKYIGNKITYNDNTIKMFLDSHRSTSDDGQLMDRLDSRINDKVPQ